MKQYTVMTLDGLKTFDNKFEELLESKFERITDKYSFYNTDIKNSYSERDKQLLEYRCLWLLSPRQTGTTCSIAASFNIKTDVYIGHKLGMSKYFKELYISIQKIVFPMMYTSLRSEVFRPVEPHKISNIKRVFIDIGGTFLLENNSLIKQIKDKIHYLDSILNDDVVYIIT